MKRREFITTWEQQDESLEAFKMRVETEAKALHQTAR